MTGFFSQEEIRSKKRAGGKLMGCATCGIYKYVLHPRIPAYGGFKKKILNIGEAPGEMEDKKGRQWQGKVGQQLKIAYEKLGIDLFEDCININSINCHPVDNKGRNRKPSPLEIACCRNRVIDVIEQYKPNLIMLLGGSAIESVIGHRWKKGLGGITKWRGWHIPDRDFGAWTCPVFHPSYVDRGEQAVQTIWEQDLKKALSLYKTPFPKMPNESSQIILLDERQDADEYEGALNRLSLGSMPPDKNYLSFDIETTGIKPHAEGHFIACISFCDSPNRAYCMKLPKITRNKKLLRKVLQSDIPKIAHNIKYEHTWIKHLLGYEVKNWRLCTMLMSHVLDNRPSVTSLKQQTYFHFGVVDYDSEITSFLTASDKGGNAFNKITTLLETEQGTKQLMTYCGMDALFTYKLGMLQLGQIEHAK